MWGAQPSEPVPDTLGRHDPVDVEAESASLAVWFFVLVLFLLSTWFAWDELGYIIHGKTVEAQVLRTYQINGRHGVSYFVQYEYRDAAGQSVTDSDGISPGWQAPSSGRVKVTYIPGEMQTSRLAGHRHYVAVSFFAACVAAVGFILIKCWREGEKVGRYLNKKDD